ncbi:hypothetical protein EBT31_03740 [bacterium]|nr:hypothetical protein [bacterium]NBX48817.1 hypothetical protein [bacterium]
MNCTSVTAQGRKCRKPALLDGKCCVHLSQTCAICLDQVTSLNSKSNKRLTCGHSFHATCIIKWYETSNECPVCRASQSEDPIIQMKLAVEERMRGVYSDAIRTLENQVRTMRRRYRQIQYE